jgi:hypothetical protein
VHPPLLVSPGTTALKRRSLQSVPAVASSAFEGCQATAMTAHSSCFFISFGAHNSFSSAQYNTSTTRSLPPIAYLRPHGDQATQRPALRSLVITSSGCQPLGSLLAGPSLLAMVACCVHT